MEELSEAEIAKAIDRPVAIARQWISLWHSRQWPRTRMVDGRYMVERKSFEAYLDGEDRL
jgi:hypothetical protein